MGLYKRYIIINTLLVISISGFAQNIGDSILSKPLKLDLGKDREIQLVHGTMVWDIFTFENAGTNEVQRRNDIFIRRGRLGVAGKLRKNMSFAVTFTYDGIGKDKYTASDGAVNSGDNQNFFLRDAFYIWNIKPMVNIVFGYFRPQIIKESITSSFNVISFDKAFQSVQTRVHLVGRPIGRETGINIGGLHLDKGWSFNYNIGLFDPTHPKIIGDGKKYAPLLTGRIALTLGDPEMTSYKIWYTQSYFGSRKGITLGLNSGLQGETEIFKSNSVYSIDLLANYKRIDFTAEYDVLGRKSFLAHDITKSTTDKIYSTKIGYQIPVKGYSLQPVFMYCYEFAENFGNIQNTNTLTGSVRQDIFDFGLNWYVNKEKFKVSLHYIKGRRFDNALNKNYSYLGTGFQIII